MAPHPRIPAWRTPWTRSLAGSDLWRRKESDMTEQLNHSDGLHILYFDWFGSVVVEEQREALFSRFVLRRQGWFYAAAALAALCALRNVPASLETVFCVSV